MHKNNLVCGSETGHEAAVPYCDYFEGMMSLAHFRVPNSGRYLQFIWENDLPIPLPEFITKFQVGQDYRLPLFELVFHDCLVSYWYLGDYNNKIPSVWEKRDLFNMLYGVPPMYLFGEDTYKRFKEQIVESYKVAQPISRETGYSEMTDFIILSNDRSVQRSVFDNGVSVTCNFGSKTYKLEDGTKLKSMTAIKGTFQKKSSTGMIVGIVIGVLIVIVIIVVVSILVIRKKRTQNEFKPAL
ncbi:hypothetical protein TRFO_01517 [Tritrichomonas foetus]|uniref:Uncharacterized protein n=1 Tax=Tritrichomonas foetus TaxID=1144522 RepID=A0A1J4K251_9EUKA|nr:hypothetical protein TRFO_01517 [Tritrichomonas foetus]|eukprot:OHT03820.1 hypothetical protein TRFO_01517 [Tritrichomonas foetus]